MMIVIGVTLGMRIVAPKGDSCGDEELNHRLALGLVTSQTDCTLESRLY
jgi:hypothetical protein